MPELRGLIGNSAAMTALRAQVERLLSRPTAGGRLPAILIQGETGVGKGLLAHAIHQASARRDGPWVEINCAAIPETLVESELFGVERGAFTDARQSKAGLFQTAHRGMLFLDEVGTLPLAVQAKLLTALEQRHVRRLGSTKSEPADVWILSATNDDLLVAIEQKRFRADLYHRLAAMTLRLPPLRDRDTDVLQLADHYLTRACADYGLVQKRVASSAREALLAYSWPGNVRELANLMERVALLTDGDQVTADVLDLPLSISRRREGKRGSGNDSAESERETLRAVLQTTRWNLSRAAAELGVPRNTLRYRIEKYGLRPDSAPEPAAGAKAAAGAPPATLRWERRWVTALRVVLVPEPGSAIFQFAPTIDRLVDKVRSFGADLEELHPQGFLAIFGLEPMEDASSRAVHAALAIQKAAERSQSVAGVTGVIHAAECLIGRGGSVAGMDPRDKTALMTRLESLVVEAPPTQLVVSSETVQFLDRRFAVVASPVPALKGHRILGYGADHFEGAGQMRTRLVGRDRELAALDDLLGAVEAGQGQAVGLAGEAGVGKSRLLYEFCQSLVLGRVTVLEGRCMAYGTSIPDLPILDLVRQNFALVDTDPPETVAAKIQTGLSALALDREAIAPYLLHLLGFKEGSEGPLATLTPEAIKNRTIEALRQLSVAGARLRPVVVTIEDLHWIDPTSEEILTVLVDSLAGSRILLLGTYRPGYRPLWLGKSYATQLVLRRLSRADSTAVVEGFRGNAVLPAQVTEMIVTHADGIPFFIEELTRAVADHADLRTSLSIPDTIHGVLTARIDRLSPEAKQLIQAAAVLGKDFAGPLLHALVPDLSEDDFRRALARLQAAEFLLETSVAPTPAYTFKHALTQQVAYSSLLPEPRRALHAAAGEAIERTAPDVPNRTPEVLARHYTEAGIPEVAIGYWHRAGKRAIERSANVEAIKHIETGLQLLAQIPAGPVRLLQELTLRTMVSSPLLMVKGYGAPEVETHLMRARAICAELGDSVDFVPVLFGLWRYYLVRGKYDVASALAADMLNLCSTANDPQLAVIAYATSGIIRFYEGRLREALEHLERAVSYYDARTHQFDLSIYGQDPGLAAMAFLGWALGVSGQIQRARSLATKSIDIARTRCHPFTLAFSLHNLTLIQMLALDADTTAVREQLDISDEQAFPFWKGSGLVMHGWVKARHGDAVGGIADMREGARLYRDSGGDVGFTVVSSTLARALLDTGDAEGAMTIADEALALGRTNGERVYEAELTGIKAEALLRLDGVNKSVATDLLESAVQLAHEQGGSTFELRYMTKLLLMVDEHRKGPLRQRVAQMLADVFSKEDTIEVAQARMILGRSTT
jgi:transcriptional regulator with AAA-type ATPase domain/predicted ATPase